MGRTVGADLECHPSDLLEVVLSSSRDPSEEDLLRNATAEGHAHAVGELLGGVEVALLGEVLSVSKSSDTTGDDRDLQSNLVSDGVEG
jgi:hypothetical protein